MDRVILSLCLSFPSPPLLLYVLVLRTALSRFWWRRVGVTISFLSDSEFTLSCVNAFSTPGQSQTRPIGVVTDHLPTRITFTWNVTARIC